MDQSEIRQLATSLQSKANVNDAVREALVEEFYVSAKEVLRQYASRLPARSYGANVFRRIIEAQTTVAWVKKLRKKAKQSGKTVGAEARLWVTEFWGDVLRGHFPQTSSDVLEHGVQQVKFSQYLLLARALL